LFVTGYRRHGFDSTSEASLGPVAHSHPSVAQALEPRTPVSKSVDPLARLELLVPRTKMAPVSGTNNIQCWIWFVQARWEIGTANSVVSLRVLQIFPPPPACLQDLSRTMCSRCRRLRHWMAPVLLAVGPLGMPNECTHQTGLQHTKNCQMCFLPLKRGSLCTGH
jgi:hypothetical protein